MFRPCLKFLAFIFMMVAAVAMFGCEGDTGSAGPAGSAGTEGEQGVQGDPGPAGATDGTVAGTVTNSATLAGIASLTITTDPVITGTTVTTDANGAYTADLPVGMYTLTFAETNFTTQTKSVNLVAGQTVTTDVALVPTSDVIASIDSSAVTTATAVPGGSFTLTASETVMDGSSILSYAWTQAASAQATITGADTATPTITLGDMAAYKAELMKHLVSNMGTDPAANLDRFMVQPVNPFALEEAGLVTFQVAITTTTGTYTKSVDVHAKLPFAVWSTGTKNVPMGLQVLLNGKDQAAYAWTLTGPAGSTAALDDAPVRNPSFPTAPRVPSALGSGCSSGRRPRSRSRAPPTGPSADPPSTSSTVASGWAAPLPSPTPISPRSACGAGRWGPF